MRWEVCGKWGVTANGYGASFGDDENIIKLVVVVAAQFCEYIKVIELYILNG